jgi:murein DD-endopeptidase MepM/ murein hydrolase activator NlpD
MKKSHIGSFIILALIAALAAGGFFLYKTYASKPPSIEGLDALKKLSRKKSAHITVSSKFALKEVSISIAQGAKTVSLVSDAPNTPRKEYDIVVEAKKLGLADGPAVIEARVKAGWFSHAEYSMEAAIKTAPPIIAVLNSSYTARQGEAAAALIKVQGASRVYVKIAQAEFPAFPDAVAEKDVYFCLFPIPMDMSSQAAMLAVAEDDFGNSAQATISTRITPFAFKKDTVNISDDFIKKQVYPILDKTPEEVPLIEAFVAVNEKLRVENEKQIRELTKKASRKILWKGAFVQMRNTKVFAGFGDMRDYRYGDKIVSHSTHMGYDLASTQNDAVPATNDGTVLFTGNLGIYGNAVMLDHGLGLVSMYAHLSSIGVSEGQAVLKGAALGKTGTTGLAGGDHLHFALILHGVYVSPVPWWDIKWIEKRITDVLHNKAP